MNNAEFDQWWDDFAARFPSKASWVENKDHGNAIAATWLEQFEHLTLVDLIAANRQMQSTGEMAECWDDTPVRIRDIAERQAVNRMLTESRTKHDEGHTPWDCICGGSGLVIVYQPKQLDEAIAGERVDKFGRAGIPCTCRHGDKYAIRTVGRGKEKKVIELPRYSPDKFCVFASHASKHMAAINEFANK